MIQEDDDDDAHEEEEEKEDGEKEKEEQEKNVEAIQFCGPFCYTEGAEQFRKCSLALSCLLVQFHFSLCIAHRSRNS